MQARSISLIKFNISEKKRFVLNFTKNTFCHRICFRALIKVFHLWIVKIGIGKFTIICSFTKLKESLLASELAYVFIHGLFLDTLVIVFSFLELKYRCVTGI